MIRFALPLIILAATGCAHPTAKERLYQTTTGLPPQPPVVPPAPTRCGQEKVAEFIGKMRTDAISTDVARLSGAKNIRWISPGMAVTMDYREDRLNARVDDKGVILSFDCG